MTIKEINQPIKRSGKSDCDFIEQNVMSYTVEGFAGV